MIKTPALNIKEINILNTKIANLSMDETLTVVHNAIKNSKKICQSSVNAGKIVAMEKDEKLRESVNSSDLINADGQAIVWASKLLNKPLKERVAGIDLMENLIASASKKNYKIFFLGAKEEVVKKVVYIYSKKYSPDIIAGYRNGYFSKDEEKAIAQDISKSNAHMLFVAMNSPNKENFLYNNREILKNINFVMGVGGSFDVVSGKLKRAPVWMQKIGMEWFFRFLQEPRKMYKRAFISNFKFICLVFKEKRRKK